MGTTNGPATGTYRDQVAETGLEIRELSDAWTRRHRLRRGTPEYESALETEERLVSRIWQRLKAGGPPVSRTPTGD